MAKSFYKNKNDESDGSGKKKISPHFPQKSKVANMGIAFRSEILHEIDVESWLDVTFFQTEEHVNRLAEIIHRIQSICSQGQNS